MWCWGSSPFLFSLRSRLTYELSSSWFFISLRPCPKPVCASASLFYVDPFIRVLGYGLSWVTRGMNVISASPPSALFCSSLFLKVRGESSLNGFFSTGSFDFSSFMPPALLASLSSWMTWPGFSNWNSFLAARLLLRGLSVYCSRLFCCMLVEGETLLSWMLQFWC